jgi:hypothetical protein
MNTTADTGQAVGLGIVFGAAVGATAGLLSGTTVAMGAGYGIATGIVTAALIEGLAPRIDGGRARLALVVLGLLGGAVGGGLVGLVVIWAADAVLAVGLAVWSVAGGTVGLLVSSSLVTGQTTTSAPDEPDPDGGTTGGVRND